MLPFKPWTYKKVLVVRLYIYCCCCGLYFLLLLVVVVVCYDCLLVRITPAEFRSGQKKMLQFMCLTKGVRQIVRQGNICQRE